MVRKAVYFLILLLYRSCLFTHTLQKLSIFIILLQKLSIIYCISLYVQYYCLHLSISFCLTEEICLLILLNHRSCIFPCFTEAVFTSFAIAAYFFLLQTQYRSCQCPLINTEAVYFLNAGAVHFSFKHLDFCQPRVSWSRMGKLVVRSDPTEINYPPVES